MLYPRETGGVTSQPGTRHEVTRNHCACAASFVSRTSPLHARFAYGEPGAFPLLHQEDGSLASCLIRVPNLPIRKIP